MGAIADGMHAGGVTQLGTSSADRSGTTTVVPLVRPGAVRRRRLIARLASAADASVVSVAAPAGYGKSIALAQWSEADPRPVAWLTLDNRDDDPVLLVRHVLESLRRAGLPGPSAARASLARATKPWPTHAQHLSGLLGTIEGGFVLVLDDVHLVNSTESLRALEALVRDVPPGSQVLLSGRRELTQLVARSRAAGAVVDVGMDELAFDEDETAELLAGVGMPLPADDVAALARRTEGWPAGTYLIALAMRATGGAASRRASGLDRYVEDYLRTELLSTLPDDELSFLTRSSVLERMSPELCDAALDRRDSRRMLEEMERSNLFLVPLDRERRWYRYHELFRAALQRELDRDDPAAGIRLRERAADWCEANGLPEDAIAYARAAGDTDRVARLFVSLSFPLYRAGRMATLEAWFAEFDDRAVVDRFPEVGVLGAFVHALQGRAYPAERWLDAVHRASGPSRPLADGSASARPWVAVADALLCRHGPERMREDALLAIDELGPFSPFRAPAVFLLGNALLMQGHLEEADARLEEAAGAAEASGATFAGASAHAQRALGALERNEIAAGRELVARARAMVAHAPFDDYMLMALCLVAEARVSIRTGDTRHAARTLAVAGRLRPYLTHAIPYYAVRTLAEMARAHLALADPATAGAVLADAAEVLRHRPRLGILVEEVAALTARSAAADRGGAGRTPTLTAAELRLLPLLTTHLTFQEIGEQLYVSRNTVKTQALSIYRKLGASSRGEAVSRAAEIGLLEPAAADHERLAGSG